MFHCRYCSMCHCERNIREGSFFAHFPKVCIYMYCTTIWYTVSTDICFTLVNYILVFGCTQVILYCVTSVCSMKHDCEGGMHDLNIVEYF